MWSQISLCLASMGYWGGKTSTFMQSCFSVAVSMPLVHPECWFLYTHPRYKKYGMRCSSCWLVPRKNVQPKRFCGRCGVSLGPHQGPTQEG